MSEGKDFDIVVLQFADSKIPEFKEVSSKDYILFGEENTYPEYLTYLYNKSSKHGAIVNGKRNYVIGSGLEKKKPIPNGFVPYVGPDETVVPAKIVNSNGESMTDVLNKSALDIEIYGGFRWFVTWNNSGNISAISQADYAMFRTGKDGGFFYKKCWDKKGGWKAYQEKPAFYPEFDANNRVGTQVFAYNEYRPGTDVYPLPCYVPCCNYIETDIEISKFHLSAIRNGMMPSKMLQFYIGEPTADKKKEVEQGFKKKFAGSENAGKFFLVFNTEKDKSVDVSDLSSNDLDKQFDLLNKTTEQHILTGHQVVSPMLFGIKTEGQLGGSNELKTAYEVFINTYAKPKQDALEKVVNYFGDLMAVGSDYYIKQLDPVGIQIDASSVITLLPKEFIYDKLNIPKEYRDQAALVPSATTAPVEAAASGVNDNLKNLTAKQHQQLLRIIRQYGKGQLTEAAAKVLLKSGLGLSDAEILDVLGITPGVYATDKITDDDAIKIFSEYGADKAGFEVIKRKSVKFSSDEDAAADELEYYALAFAGENITDEEILSLIAKDKRMPPEVMADALNTTAEAVTAKLADMTSRGLITSKEVKVGEDVQIERESTSAAKEVPKTDAPEISIMYSYEGPQDSKNRPFCARLMKLDRLYTRYEIELMSQRLGYSVFDRRGGFWRHKDGTITPYCRHDWKSNVVVKRRAKA